jgi:hypothetical protein
MSKPQTALPHFVQDGSNIVNYLCFTHVDHGHTYDHNDYFLVQIPRRAVRTDPPLASGDFNCVKVAETY